MNNSPEQTPTPETSARAYALSREIQQSRAYYMHCMDWRLYDLAEAARLKTAALLADYNALSAQPPLIMTPETTHESLLPCASLLREYVRKEDANGLCIFDDVEVWSMGALTATLRGCFDSFVLDGEANFDRSCKSRGLDPRDPAFVRALNLEDRENSFAVLERAEAFGSVAYAGEFLRLAPYILHNASNE